MIQVTRALYFSAWIAITSAACRSSPPIDRSSSSPPATGEVNAGAASVGAAAPGSANTVGDAAISVTDASTDSPRAASAAPGPLERLLRDAAASDDALVAAIHTTRGLSVIEYIEAPPNGRGRMRRSAEQLCGATLRQRARSLREHITRALTRAAEGQDIVCEAEMCSVPGMEFEPTKRFRFILADDGARPSLESIETVSEAAMGDTWLSAARTHTNATLATHRNTQCRAR